MTSQASEISQLALNLPQPDRAALAHLLLTSLDDRQENESDVAAAWDSEIERRVNEIKSGTAKGRPASEVLGEIRAKYS